MQDVADQSVAPTTIGADLCAIFVSLELSRSTWLATSLSPGRGEKMSKHSVSAGDIAALLARFSELRRKACARTGKSFPIVVIQEAGLDGFWIHRVLLSEGIESHVVDAASIATSRRRRRAKTDRIDGETLLRALLAHKRGEPRVCSMVRAPTPEDEDRRRICREPHISKPRFVENSIGSNCFSSRSRLWRPSETRCSTQNKPKRRPRRRCCWVSVALGRSSLRSSGLKDSPDTSTTADRSPLMRALPRRLGKAGRSITSRASRNRATGDYGQQ
jgi:hypothetical protein